MNGLNKTKDRLFAEWVSHGKIIIAVDFDDTVSSWKLFSQEEIEFSGIFKILKKCTELGAYLVCFTACSQDRYEHIRDFFLTKGIHISTINENPINLPYGNSGKIYANIFLDDRGGLFEALKILDDVSWRYAGHLQSKGLTEQTVEF